MINITHNGDNLETKVMTAAKWSAITEVVARLVTPILSLVLARMLTPEVFGLVATITMIITFAEIFTDAGFQKYIIQHKFTDEEDLDKSTNVAFWSNLVMSLIIWLIIITFNSPLATIVGNPGLGHVLIVACVSIPLAAFSSIQMALYKRKLDFKILFKVRTVSVIAPLFVTLPLAFFLRNYWALILGTITQNCINVLLLYHYSSWKPRLYYSKNRFKEMFSFTSWSLVEAISIWMTSYVDVFVIGTFLNQYYLGLYKTTSSLVGQVFGIITASITPVLFSSLSKIQDDKEKFTDYFYKFQSAIAIVVFPIGTLFFCYSHQITSILLGAQWLEAADFVGLWGLTTAITLVFCSNFGEVYRSLGKPKISVIVQWLHIIVLVPVVVYSAKQGFEQLSFWRSMVRFEAVLVNIIAVCIVAYFNLWDMLVNTIHQFIGSLIICIIAYLTMSFANSNLFALIAIVIIECIVYLAYQSLFCRTRQGLLRMYKSIVRKK